MAFPAVFQEFHAIMDSFRFTRREFVRRDLACGAAAVAAGRRAGCAGMLAMFDQPSPVPADGELRPVECMPMLYWTGVYLFSQRRLRMLGSSRYSQ